MTIYDLSLGGGLAPLSRFTNLFVFFSLGLTSCRRWVVSFFLYAQNCTVVISFFFIAVGQYDIMNHNWSVGMVRGTSSWKCAFLPEKEEENEEERQV
jgi:hypothetical protein